MWKLYLVKSTLTNDGATSTIEVVDTYQVWTEVRHYIDAYGYYYEPCPADEPKIDSFIFQTSPTRTFLAVKIKQ
jgi:hypothetical protein